MFIIKNDYKGKDVIISVRRGLTNQLLIDLDAASQAELKLLFDMKHPYVQQSEQKEKVEKSDKTGGG